MRKNILRKFVLATLSLFLLLALSGCSYSAKIQKYYSERDNYVNATGTISFINLNDENTGLYLGFSDLNPQFSDNCFRITGDNLSIVLEKDLDKKLAIGDQVEFISAPGYFGDGYVMPIVAITVDGNEYLKFEEGFVNLQKWLQER